LNVTQGKWVQHHDVVRHCDWYHQVCEGDLLISWSMSRVGANVLARRHRLDATVQTELFEADSLGVLPAEGLISVVQKGAGDALSRGVSRDFRGHDQ
jgi:hypothetical protein